MYHLSRKRLDKSVEEYLALLLKRNNMTGEVIDFEVTDALDKLKLMGILVDGDNPDAKTYQVGEASESL